MNIDNSLRLDKDATALAFGYKEGIDMGLFRIAPIIAAPGNLQYPEYARGAFYHNKETQRAPGANIQEFDYPTETWTAYVCEEHALVGKIDRQNRARSRVQGMVYSSPAACQKALTIALTQSLCYKIVSMVFSITNLSGQYATPGTKWDAAGAVPYDDLQAWYIAFKDGCGKAPNGFAISDRLLTYLGEYLRIKYNWTSGYNRELIRGVLTADFGCAPENFVIITGEYYSSTKFVNLVADNCLFFYAPPTMNDWEPSLCATIVPNDSDTTMNGLGVFTPYPNEHGTWIWNQVVREYKVVMPMKYAGYMGYDCADGF